MITLFSHPALAALAILATPFAIMALGRHVLAPVAFALAGAPVLIVRGLATGRWQ